MLFSRNGYPRYLLMSMMLFLMASCSSTQSYFLESEYESDKIKASVGILLIEQESFPDLYTHSFSSLNSRQERTFRLFLEPLYTTHSETEAWLVEPEVVSDPGGFTARTFTVGETEFEVLVPESSSALQFAERPPRFLLILDQYYYREAAEVTGESTYAGHEASITRILAFQAHYVYWDVVSEQVVGYGTAGSQMNLEAEEPTVSEYSDVLSETLQQIARWGPIATR